MHIIIIVALTSKQGKAAFIAAFYIAYSKFISSQSGLFEVENNESGVGMFLARQSI